MEGTENRIRLIPWEESFEVCFPDGPRKFFCFDENAGRRSINGRVSQAEALEQAKNFAREEQDKLAAGERS
ncbi:hypothetical protein IVB11_27565 [Bradyrhizobium sp. 177]|uniref:hypothetical protein n=1 Tax=Bradyrhizobium sp. 177 TaxID=2782647 RepID=UPI001FF76481|nr:hypothetical protein [Bradyrhizobium sp. 177]MCK1552698.1 hypothetical protein [Bradyrhizobium sp. 177]